MEYQFLLLPLIAALIAQVGKLFIKSNKKKLSFRNIIAYSGMPSGHTATTVAMSTIVGLELGIASPLFAVAFIVTLLIIRDAVGLRRYIGRHGEVINDLVEDLDEDKLLDDKYPKMLEAIGHTSKQVLVGAIIGFIVSYGGWLLIN